MSLLKFFRLIPFGQMCTAFDAGNAGVIGNPLGQGIQIFAKALPQSPLPFYFAEKGAGAEMAPTYRCITARSAAIKAPSR